MGKRGLIPDRVVLQDLIYTVYVEPEVIIMIIQAPTLDREEEATAENIAEIVRRLKGKDKTFAILKKTNTTFIQTQLSHNFPIVINKQKCKHAHQIIN